MSSLFELVFCSVRHVGAAAAEWLQLRRSGIISHCPFLICTFAIRVAELKVVHGREMLTCKRPELEAKLAFVELGPYVVARGAHSPFLSGVCVGPSRRAVGGRQLQAACQQLELSRIVTIELFHLGQVLAGEGAH